MSITSLDKNTVKLLTTTQVITSVYTAVKELVENAFDAHAENIEVNLVDNGTSLIEVKDDGDGIPNEDASYMALASFTSKISSFEDLGMLQTYGFRGEALNALCKIADVVIITKTDKEEVGRLYNMDNNGNIESTKLHPRQKGTTVQIKQIFKNFPVRRKIITNTKKTNQDIKLLEILLKSFGICNPMIRIHYRVNNNMVFIKPNLSSIKEATEYILGSKVMSDMKWIIYEEAEVTVQLMVPDKEVQDINEICQANHYYIFVNNRPIKCKDIEKTVSGIISEYFGKKLAARKKPIFLLHILVDPMDIDVNLEPNKDAILFKNQQQILDIITKHLTNLYGIQTEKETIQHSTDISDCYKDISSTTNENISETEWPTCKKRKISPSVHEELIEKPQSKKLNGICSDNVINNINEKNNVSEDELQAISNYLNTTVLNESSTHNVDVNSISYNKPMHNSNNNRDNTVYTDDSLLRDLNLSDERLNSQSIPNTVGNHNNGLSETISQLPVVDLGEDFELDVILNKESNVNMQIDQIHNAQSNKNNDLNIREKYSLETWSKGHVKGIKGGTDVKPCFISMDSSPMESTFTKFAKDARVEIMMENPKQSAAEVARKITDMWKHLPSQEHGYYQDLACEERNRKEEEKNERKNKVNTDIKKNKQRLLRLLENMKNTNTQKSENLVMRTIIPWDINTDKVTTSFKNGCQYNNTDHVIGSVSINLWIIQNSAQLWILDISHILKGFNITDLTIDKIQPKDVERLFKQWILEKKDMSMIFPIYTLT